MSPESVHIRARSLMRCHPQAGVLVDDHPINRRGEWRVLAMCARCRNSRMVTITDHERDIMDDMLPWPFLNERY